MEIDSSMPIRISLIDNPCQLLCCKSVTQFHHGVCQLSCRDESIAVPIKHLKQLSQLIVCIRRLGR